MRLSVGLVAAVVVCLATPVLLQQQQDSSCVSPDDMEGTCMPIKECPVLYEQLKAKLTDTQYFQFLKASNRICASAFMHVCCPNGLNSNSDAAAPLSRSTNEIPTRLPTPAEGCGLTDAQFKRVVGGENSARGAWPWIALLGYSNSKNRSPFKCGGTLVSARHVVTAAHCLLKDLSFVRLGEHDLSTDTETSHVDVRVVRVERNPNYNPRNGKGDIAILYLERNVDLTKFIVPICLPQEAELREKSYLKYSPFVAGWGLTSEKGIGANVLQELKIPIHETQECKEVFRRHRRLHGEDQFDEGVICAGVQEGGKDTCHGDSGGPLMIPEAYGDSLRFYLIGVVSYGIGCAREDSLSAYTSTQYFMDWIIEKIADTH